MDGDLSQGFGDTDIGDIVARYQRWSHWEAGRTLGNVGTMHPSYDDVQQEGLIAIWHALATKGERVNNAVYLTKAARSRMRDVAWSGKPMLGSSDGKPGPKSRPTTVAIDYDALSDEDPMMRLLEAVDALSAVEWAYHHGEIAQCLNGLSADDRDYVVQRFWGGKTDTEIAAERRVDKRVVHQNWVRRIRPQVAEQLSRLATVY